jgi:hypothetical protein
MAITIFLLLVLLVLSPEESSALFVPPSKVDAVIVTQEEPFVSHVLSMGQVHVESLSLQLPPEPVQPDF